MYEIMINIQFSKGMLAGGEERSTTFMSCVTPSANQQHGVWHLHIQHFAPIFK